MDSFTHHQLLDMAVLLILFLVHPLNVICEKLVPKGTSYGFVPKDSKIIRYSEGNHWEPIQTENQDPSSKSLKNYEEGYHYDHPSSQYLPPAEDFPTLPPTDEEFINIPQHDDTPSISSINGYDYPRPETPFNDLQPPVSHDEPTSQYLPPPVNFPGVEIAKKAPEPDVDRIDGRQLNQEHPLHIEVTEMNCFDASSNGKFQTILTVKSPNENIPVFEDATESACFLESDHSPPRMNSKLRFSISKNQFLGCGVKDCSTSKDVMFLCVRLRFPTIAKMRLIEDPILTLQCRTQDRIAAHTKHLQLDIDNSISSRSNTIAHGGTKKSLRSRVTLLRRGSRGEFSEVLPPKARVSLGEMLMLKTEVDRIGGWLSSRLSSVGLSSIRGGSGLQLLGADGCRTARARLLCPRESLPVSPLSHTLLLKAAMFDGMKSGDEMRLSVRIVACLDPADCVPSKCGIIPRLRNRRSSPPQNETEDSTSELLLEVFIPEEDSKLAGMPRTKTPIILMISLLSVTILCSSIVILLKSKR